LVSCGENRDLDEYLRIMADLVVYRIDPKDRIDFFNAEFLAAAREAGSFDASSIYGMPIWSYIGDEDIAGLYRQVYDKVRTTREPSVLSFRSDLPTARRSVQMEVRCLDNGGIEHSCRVALDEKRPPIYLLETKAPRSNSFVKMCGWCARVQVFPKWVEPEEASRMLAPLSREPLPEIVHGLCPVCFERHMNLKRIAA
jgi:hypothetical protein